MICSPYCTVTGCHAILSFLTSLRLTLPRPLLFFILQRHNTTIRMHLNINADTNNKCTNTDYNIATEYMFAWNINSWSVIHRPVFLFIHSLYNQADVWRADHNPVYGKRVREKTKVGSQTWYTTMYITHGSLLPPTVLIIVLYTECTMQVSHQRSFNTVIWTKRVVFLIFSYSLRSEVWFLCAQMFQHLVHVCTKFREYAFLQLFLDLHTDWYDVCSANLIFSLGFASINPFKN